MSRTIATARIRALGIDSEPYSHMGDPAHAKALRAEGVEFVISYLGALTSAMLDNILAAGLAFMPCTYADDFDPAKTVARLQALGVPHGATVWLDVESVTGLTPEQLIIKINAWADGVRRNGADGWDPGIYVGAGTPLTADQLAALRVDRYWRSCSFVPEPCFTNPFRPIGFCMTQIVPPNQMCAGVLVDYDFVHRDYHLRGPTWVVASSVGSSSPPADPTADTTPPSAPAA